MYFLRLLCINLSAGFLLVLFSIDVSSQNLNVRYEHISVEQGLSQSSIWSILQDRDGFLWFGTADGLNRYDGNTFKVFRHDPQDTTSLRNNTIWCVAPDSSDNLLIGTSSGLHRYNKTTGTFHRFSDEQRFANTPLAGRITRILRDRTGILWIGTLRGTVAFDPATAVIDTFPPSSTVPPSVSQSPCGALYEDSTGLILVGTVDGLFSYDRNFRKFESIGLGTSSEKFYITTLFRDRRGTYWAGTNQYGLFFTNDLRSPWQRYHHDPTDPHSISDNVIRCINEDESGNLWVGTSFGGVQRFDRSTRTFTRFVPTTDGKGNARFEGATQIYRDRSGLLWIGYDGSGLVKVNPHRSKFPHFLLPPSSGKKTGDNFFKSAMEDHAGTLWLGTYDQGIITYERRTGSIQRYQSESNTLNSLSNNSIIALFEDRSGKIWVGTMNGVDEFDPLSRRFHHYTLAPQQERPSLSNIVNAFSEDSSGRIWAGTAAGLFSFNPEEKKFVQEVRFPAFDGKGEGVNIFCLQCDHDGALLLGTHTMGICKFDPLKKSARWYQSNPSDTNSLSNNSTKTICLESADVAWVGTEGGLNRLDLTNGSCTRYYVKDGLANDFIYGILSDEHARLWISTNRGLSKMEITDYLHPKFRNYTPDDGLQSYEFNTGVYCKLKDGELLFGGVNGFNVFFPDSVTDNPVLPSIVFTGFKKFDQPVNLGFDLNRRPYISLTYLESVFSFEFAALEFTDPARNQYAYIMEGFDREWSYSGNRREARYTNLASGKYTFRIKGSNNDGVWNPNEASVILDIAPPFWKTWWAYTLYVLFLASAGIGTRWLAQNWNIIVANRKARYVSHYKLMEKLGEGGMGKVYKAVDVNTRQIVALKVLNPELLKDAENRKRLVSEGHLLSSFSHPHILKVFEVGESVDRGFIAMEFLSGGTLKEYLDKRFPLPQEKLKQILLEICDGIQEIHAHDVIHRDLKTTNIMLDGMENVRIMDFGLSKSPLLTTMTTLGTVLGTLGYVAPEQVTGINVDRRVDIFSFGVILYELLTHQLPFKGENEIAVIHSIFNTNPPRPSSIVNGIASGLDNIVATCLAKKPEERFSSIAEVRVALKKEFC